MGMSEQITPVLPAFNLVYAKPIGLPIQEYVLGTEYSGQGEEPSDIMSSYLPALSCYQKPCSSTWTDHSVPTTWDRGARGSDRTSGIWQLTLLAREGNQ